MSAKLRIILQSVTTVMFCIVLVMLIGYTKMFNVLLDNRIQFYNDSMKLQSKNIDYFTKLIENITDYSTSTPTVTKSLGNESFDSVITNSLSDLRSINLDIIGATIYSCNGTRYESNNVYNFPTFDVFSTSKEYIRFKSSSQDKMWMLCTEDIPTYKYSGSKDEDVISYYKNIYNSSDLVGFAVVNVSTSSFMKYFSDDSFDSRFSLSLFTPGGKLAYEYGDSDLFLPTEDEINNLIHSGKEYQITKDQKHLIIAKKLFGRDTYIIKTISLSNFYSRMNGLKFSFIAIALFLLIALILLYSRLAKSIFSPLLALHDKMATYGD